MDKYGWWSFDYTKDYEPEHLIQILKAFKAKYPTYKKLF
jgi:hypothetical protein